MKLAALIGAALMLAPAAIARERKMVGDWIVVPNKTSCYALTLFNERDTGATSQLSIGYNAKTKLAMLSFSNSKATSVADGTKHQLEIFLVNPNGRSDDDWGAVEFTVVVEDSGERNFNSEVLDKQILDDVSKAKTLAFFVDETLVSSFGMSGSSKAIAELRKCAFEVVGMNPLDPFLK